ncbi:MAG: CBS domain-containing protein [Xanthomonadaceae bacterium]|nr:CBS domain-containing protein [Xanthomonadaceae bacterium]HRQ35546.1 transporter associated domain-containing protein [Chiayiivirga sp.]
MPEEPSSTSGSPSKSWLERLGQALSSEPRSREELVDELRTAQANGLLSAETLAMMEGAIRVTVQSVGDVMVPRAQMVSIDVELPYLDVVKVAVESGHSRFPVHGEDRDEVLGILLAKDLLRAVAEGRQPGTLRELLRPAVLIPESKRLNVLLKEFRLTRNHMAIVVDEYGGVAGLVTIEDLLEQIVGEIDDEYDDEPHEGLIEAQADGRYVVDALTTIGDFNKRFGADFDDSEYDTLGGMLAAAIGHLPETGEEISIGRFDFRIARADARRVQVLHMTVRGDA